MVSVAFVIPTRPDGLHEINLPVAFCHLFACVCAHFKPTEAALLSRMMVFSAVTKRANLLSCSEMSTGKQLPTDDTTARRNVRHCASTSRNVRQAFKLLMFVNQTAS
jgi:hypothetical protein